MSELTPEDSLRLNVMLAGDIQAIRIDASNMTIYGLSQRGTASVKLHPVGRSDQYLRTARELLAGFAIGSPRWLPGIPATLDAHGTGTRQGSRPPFIAWGARGRDLGGLLEWFNG